MRDSLEIVQPSGRKAEVLQDQPEELEARGWESVCFAFS